MPPPPCLVALRTVPRGAAPPHMKAKKAAQVLGVNEGDDEATITAAFRTRAAQWHPDRNEGNRDEATRRFEEINRAFRALNQNGNPRGRRWT